MTRQSWFLRLIWPVFVFFVAANFVSDIVLWNHTERVSVSSTWIQHSYQTIQELDRLSADLLLIGSDKISQKENDGAFADLRQHVSRLHNLMSESPPQIQRVEALQKLLGMDLQASQILQARELLRNLRMDEDGILVQRLKKSELDTHRTRKEIIFGSILDTFLLLTTLSVYWLERRRWRQTEMALLSTLDVSKSTNQRLQSLNDSKAELFRSTVHDLKNPLGSIMGFADLIHTDLRDADSVVLMSKHIQRISQDTLELVNSLLRNSALEFGRLELQLGIFDGRNEINQVCSQMRALAQSKNQRLILNGETKLPLYGDAQRFREILQNLIGNALKFSPLGSSVFVSSELKGDIVRIEVEDEGPGLSQCDKEKAFRKFQKLSAQPTGGETSSGLGLAIVKELIELHKGRVFIDNSLGEQGARFVIELPVESKFATHDFGSN